MFVQSERSVNRFGFTLSFGLVSLSVHPYFVRQNTDEPNGTENQGVLWCWYGRFIKHFYVKSQNGGRFSGEDDNKCKKKCTFAARSVF